MKKKRSCSHCNKPGHYIATCPDLHRKHADPNCERVVNVSEIPETKHIEKRKKCSCGVFLEQNQKICNKNCTAETVKSEFLMGKKSESVVTSEGIENLSGESVSKNIKSSLKCKCGRFKKNNQETCNICFNKSENIRGESGATDNEFGDITVVKTITADKDERNDEIIIELKETHLADSPEVSVITQHQNDLACSDSSNVNLAAERIRKLETFVAYETQKCRTCGAAGHNILRCPLNENIVSSYNLRGMTLIDDEIENIERELSEVSDSIERVDTSFASKRSYCCKLCGNEGHGRAFCSWNPDNYVSTNVSNTTETNVKASAIDETRDASIYSDEDADNADCTQTSTAGETSTNASISADEDNTDCTQTSTADETTTNASIYSEEDADNAASCACCHRCASLDIELPLQPLDVPFIRRIYGDTKFLQENDEVCKECYNYLRRSNQYAKWNSAWPSVIYTLLTKAEYSTDATKLIEFLPLTLRLMWRNIYNELVTDVRNKWGEDSIFRDITQEMKDFESHIKSYKFTDMYKILNETAYPTIMCPMGCFSYMRENIDGKQLSIMPANHYLLSISKKFKGFDSDINKVKGFRPDWPYKKEAWKNWMVTPCLIMDPKAGLSIVHCGSKQHVVGNYNYVHVPRHPVYGDKAPLYPDTLAPAVVVPNIVRSGCSNAQNTSYMVLKQRGNSAGVSTFNLDIRPPKLLSEVTHTDVKAWGLTLTNRMDVLHSMVQASSERANTCKHVLSYYNKRCLNNSGIIKEHPDNGKYIQPREGIVEFVPDPVLDKERIQKAVETGTYVDRSDAIHLLKSFHGRMQKHTEEENDEETDSTNNCNERKYDECLQYIHPANSSGKTPHNRSFRKPKDHKAGMIITTIVQLLLNCRALHRLLLDQKRKHPDNNLLNDTHKLCLVIVKGTLGYTVQQSLNLENRLVAAVVQDNLTSDDHPAQLVSAILRLLCNVKVIKLTDEENLEDCLGNEDGGVVVFDASDITENDSVPTEIDDWNLLIGCNVYTDETTNWKLDVNCRWTHNHDWWRIRSDGATSSSSSLCSNSFQLMVYATKKQNACLEKNEHLNMTGGQTKLKCQQHQKYLIREHVGCKYICCHERCSTRIRWRCPNGYGTNDQCGSGLCFKHSNLLMKETSPSEIDPRNSKKSVEEGEKEEEVEEEILFLDEDIPEDPHDYGFSGVDAVNLVESQIPLITKSSSSLNVVDKCHKSLSGQFLLNEHLKCFGRASVCGKAPVALQNMLQYLESISPDACPPTLYPEGLLFPRIFWKDLHNSIVGALPSVIYSEFGRRSRPGGFASLADHFRVRLLDGDSLTSRDSSYISFIFDVYLNHVLHGNSISIAIKKGLENINRTYVLPESRQGQQPFGEIDSRKQVNRLCSMIQENSWTYFLTITCNDSESMGVGPIRKAIARIHHEDSPEFEQALQNECANICRAWERSIRYYFDYLKNSPEKPIGDVLHYWLRFEFQNTGAPGNRPHVHAGITLKPETLNEEKDLERISIVEREVFSRAGKTDFETLEADGIVKNVGDFGKLMTLSAKMAEHRCSRGKSRCMKRSKDGSMVCKVRRHPPTSRQHAIFEERPHHYSDDTIKLLLEMGLAAYDERDIVVVHKKLVDGTWLYPADYGDPHRVPIHARTFIAFRSPNCLEMCGHGKDVAAYMATYMGGKDSKREVVITSTEKPKEVQVEANDLLQEKISGSMINEKKANPDAKEALAREISLPEMFWFLLNLDFVITDIEFKDVSTHAMEDRCSVFRRKTGRLKRIVDESGKLIPVVMRNELPQWRQFTSNQELIISDYSEAKYYLDPTTGFSVRPPELMSINQLRDYIRWFDTSYYKKYCISDSISIHPFLDGHCRQVKVRLNYVEEVKEHFRKLTEIGTDGAQIMYDLFVQISSDISSGSYSDLVKRFVAIDSKLDVVVAFSPITPNNFAAFLYHLLLTMGRYETELDLSSGSYLKAFEYAGLIEDAGQTGENEVKKIAKKYILEQLVFLPLRLRRFSYLVSAVVSGLRKFFSNGIIGFDYMPLVSHRAIQLSATKKLADLEFSRLQTLVTGLEGQGLPGFPDIAEPLRAMQRIEYNPVFQHVGGQSTASAKEQKNALLACTDAVDQYMNPDVSYVKFPLLTGPPGAGKTHVLLTAAVYGMTKRLRTVVVAVTAERARLFGGQHMHVLFGIPVTESYLSSVNMTVEKCILTLIRTPVSLAFLRRIDVFIFEEIGLLPAHMFIVIDCVLRRIRDCPLPFGGALLIASGDPCQLTPITGRSLWTSNHMFTTFVVLQLKHFVRCRGDADLQKIIVLMRKAILTEEETLDVIDTIKHRCVPEQFVESWDKVDSNVLKIVGKKSAQREVIEKFVEEKRRTRKSQSATFKAVDEVETTTNNWNLANESVSRKLDRQTNVPRELFIYPGAVMSLTYNNNSDKDYKIRFSQGQLCQIQSVPDSNTDRSHSRITAKIVPAGQRQIDEANIPTTWPEISLARKNTPPIVVGNGMMKGRRYQWPLNYFACLTAHKALGITLTRMATQISATKPQYSLWQREQLLVIISRVPSLDDITFVGEPDDTFLAMKELLMEDDPWKKRVEDQMNSLDVLHGGGGFVPATLPQSLISLESDVPAVDCGFVYMVVSAKQPMMQRVGDCANIRKVLEEMNSAFLDGESHLRPWVLYCFICGFPGGGKDEVNKRYRDYITNYAMINNNHSSKEAFTLLEASFQWGKKTSMTKNIVMKQCLMFKDFSEDPDPDFVEVSSTHVEDFPECVINQDKAHEPCSGIREVKVKCATFQPVVILTDDDVQEAERNRKRKNEESSKQKQKFFKEWNESVAKRPSSENLTADVSPPKVPRCVRDPPRSKTRHQKTKETPTVNRIDQYLQQKTSKKTISDNQNHTAGKQGSCKDQTSRAIRDDHPTAVPKRPSMERVVPEFVAPVPPPSELSRIDQYLQPKTTTKDVIPDKSLEQPRSRFQSTSESMRDKHPPGTSQQTLVRHVPDIIEPDYTEPVVTGLANLGNTCYMNAVLQCLNHTPGFREDIQVNQLEMASTSTALSTVHDYQRQELATVVRDLWSRSHQIVKPLALVRSVQASNSNFVRNSQQDAHEFFLYILNLLGVNINEMNDIPSFVSQQFSGHILQTTHCHECHNESPTSERFTNLSLPLPDQSSKSCRLDDCISDYMKDETIRDWKCDKCKKTGAMTRSIKMTDIPPVLVIHLKRCDNTMRKNHIDINFDINNLTMTNHTVDGEAVRFRLYSVICHEGSSLKSGHYYAVCRMQNGDFYEINDAHITRKEDSKINQEYGRKAYMLFYRKN